VIYLQIYGDAAQQRKQGIAAEVVFPLLLWKIGSKNARRVLENKLICTMHAYIFLSVFQFRDKFSTKYHSKKKF